MRYWIVSDDYGLEIKVLLYAVSGVEVLERNGRLVMQRQLSLPGELPLPATPRPDFPRSCSFVVRFTSSMAHINDANVGHNFRTWSHPERPSYR